MKELFQLYQFIKNKYTTYLNIAYSDDKIVITCYKNFNIKISWNGFYKIYFNNIFYYDVDWQDIIDTVDDILTNKYIFCELKQRNKSTIKIIPIEDYKENDNIINAWSIDKKWK